MNILKLFSFLVLFFVSTAAFALKPGSAVLIDPSSQTGQPCEILQIIGNQALIMHHGYTTEDGAAFVPCKLLYNVPRP